MLHRTVIAITLLSLGCLFSCGQEAVEPPAPETAAVEPPAPEVAAIEILNWRTPVEGLLTGGQPTPEQISEAARAGYTTIVNLRADAEEGFAWESDLVEGLGMRYVHIPVAGAAGLTRENVDLLSAVLDDRDGPMMIHCASGNRVGAMMALEAAWVDGATADEAVRIGQEFGMTQLEQAVLDLLAEN